MRVFSVPVSVPLLRTVITALVDGRLVDGFKARANPERLAQATLYLPTRRAGRLAREIFLDVLQTEAAILPRIVALGDIDEDELAFSEDGEPGGIAPLDIPPRLGELERRLALTRLVAAWAKRPVLSPLVVGGPASTLTLAGDLARLIDDMVTRGVDWNALDRLVPDQFDKPSRAGPVRQILAAHAGISADRPRVLAGLSRRGQQDRTRRAPRSLDRRRSRAPDQVP